MDDLESLRDWFSLPVTARLNAASITLEGFLSSLDEQKPVTLSDLHGLMAALGMLGEREADVRMSITGMTLGIAEAERLSEDYPELAPRIASLAFQLLAATAPLVQGNIAVRHAGLGKRLAPLAEKSASKTAAAARAQAIAAEAWQADTDQEYRLLDMAQAVRDAMQSEGFTNLPGIGRIKEWIKPAAPEYARKGGRSVKPPAPRTYHAARNK